MRRKSLKIFFLSLLFLAGIAFTPRATAQFLGLNFADTLDVHGITAEMVMNQHGQKAFRLLATTLAHVPSDKVKEGWVSWGFIPLTVDYKDKKALHEYLYDRHYGFSNETDNVVIDEGDALPDEPVRIAIFSWKCVTAACDEVKDIPRIQFISREEVNYRNLPVGRVQQLTAE